MKLIAILLCALSLIACGGGKSIKTAPQVEQFIDGDITFIKPIRNQTFVVRKEGATVDLGGLTHGYTNARYAFRVVAPGVSIINGTITAEGVTTGIIFNSCIRQSDFIKLTADPAGYQKELWQRCSTGGLIKDVTLVSTKDGVYVGPYVNGISIEDSTFNRVDAVAIYGDTGSADVTIKNNTFTDNGFRYVRKSGRPRAHIALDGSWRYSITGNTFDDKGKIKRTGGDYVPAISAYNNCGEATFNGVPLPRVHGSRFHSIKDNTFKDVSRGVWLQYREHNNIFSSCVKPYYPDLATDNVVQGNTYLNVQSRNKDDGDRNSMEYQ